uniref:Uncharacterized protein n=1 Tax=Rhizophora mucronata TaxID=61149 RepID=A0A2P2NIU3_RHIMU
MLFPTGFHLSPSHFSYLFFLSAFLHLEIIATFCLVANCCLIGIKK